MLFRIWTLLVAAMLLAAPAGDASAAEVIDAHGEVAPADAAVMAQIAIDLPAPTPTRTPIAECDEPLPPAPALARVFRPPRRSLA